VLVVALVLGCATSPVAGPPPAPTAVSTASAGGSPRVAAEEDPHTPPPFDLRCEDPAACPESVGMVVFPAEGEPERCTAALLGPRRLLTASHCLPVALRAPGASCRGAWAAFPQSGHRDAEWIECDGVEAALPVADDEVLRPDYAVLRLRSPVSRVPLIVEPVAVRVGSIVTVVSVTPHRVYGTQHRLEARLCRVRGVDFAEGALGPRAADVGWLSDCPIRPGNSGSPVLDREGRLRAIVHGGSHPFFQVGVTSRIPDPG